MPEATPEQQVSPVTLKHTEACPLFCGTAAIEKETRTKQVKRFALYLVHLTKTRYIILFAFVILSPSFVNVNNKNSLYSVFTQICHWFSVCASCLKFSASFSAPYKFVQAVPSFSRIFKRQQIAKFAKFVKPLSQRLQLFNCISLVFSKISEILQEYFLFSHFDRFRAISFSCAS